MGRSVFHSPVLHGLRHHISRRQRHLAAMIDDILHFRINLFRQTLFHLAKSEHILTENLFEDVYKRQ